MIIKLLLGWRMVGRGASLSDSVLLIKSCSSGNVGLTPGIQDVTYIGLTQGSRMSQATKSVCLNKT